MKQECKPNIGNYGARSSVLTLSYFLETFFAGLVSSGMLLVGEFVVEVVTSELVVIVVLLAAVVVSLTWDLKI